MYFLLAHDGGKSGRDRGRCWGRGRFHGGLVELLEGLLRFLLKLGWGCRSGGCHSGNGFNRGAVAANVSSEADEFLRIKSAPNRGGYGLLLYLGLEQVRERHVAKIEPLELISHVVV